MNSLDHEVLATHGELNSNLSNSTLRQLVKNALEHYLLNLDDLTPVNLYQLVMEQIEKPLFEVVMKLTKNNQSKAAKLLGLSRGTLRKKLKQYDLED
jgi:Fis family transcriptional regulator, factor for inversion stimulation protein